MEKLFVERCVNSNILQVKSTLVKKLNIKNMKINFLTT